MSPIEAWRRELSTPLNTLQGELNRLLGSYWGQEGEEAPNWIPAIDLCEAPGEFDLWVDLPGVDPETIELTITGRTLTLKGERPPGARTGPSQEILSEGPAGRFHRTLELPADVNADATHAQSRHGVLQIRIPKAAASVDVEGDAAAEPVAVPEGKGGT